MIDNIEKRRTSLLWLLGSFTLYVGQLQFTLTRVTGQTVLWLLTWIYRIKHRETTGGAREEEKEENVEFSSVRSAGAALSVPSRKETFINRQPVSLLPNAPALSNDPE